MHHRSRNSTITEKGTRDTWNVHRGPLESYKATFACQCIVDIVYFELFDGVHEFQRATNRVLLIGYFRRSTQVSSIERHLSACPSRLLIEALMIDIEQCRHEIVGIYEENGI